MLHRTIITILFSLYTFETIAEGAYHYSPNVYYGDVSSSFSRISAIQNNKISDFKSDVDTTDLVARSEINTEALLSYSHSYPKYKIYSFCEGNFLNKSKSKLDYGLSIVNKETGEVKYIILSPHNKSFTIIDLSDIAYKLNFTNPPNYQNRPELLCFGNSPRLKTQSYAICAGLGYYTYADRRFYACYRRIGHKFIITDIINTIS